MARQSQGLSILQEHPAIVPFKLEVAGDSEDSDYAAGGEARNRSSAGGIGHYVGEPSDGVHYSLCTLLALVQGDSIHLKC